MTDHDRFPTKAIRPTTKFTRGLEVIIGSSTFHVHFTLTSPETIPTLPIFYALDHVRPCPHTIQELQAQQALPT